VVALRGDPIGGLGTAYAPHPQGYRRTCDLVAGIKAVGDFEVSVSAYPEKHPEAASLEADIDELQAKLDELAGDAWLDRGQLSEADKRTLDATLAEYEKAPDAGSSWDQVKARVQSKLRP